MRDLPRLAVALAVLSGCQFDASGSGESSASDSAGGSTSASASTDAPETGTSGGGSGMSSTSGSTTGDTTTSTTGADASSGDDPTTPDPSGSTTSLSATSTTTEGPAPSCDRALWVTGNTAVDQTDDATLYARLLEEGFTVTPVQSAASSAADVGDNCVVILSSVGSSGDINTKFRDVSVGVVVLESPLYDDMQMVNSGALGWEDGQDDIVVIDAAHPLAAGYSGTVGIYSGGGRISWGAPLTDAQVVAIWPNAADRATLFGYEAGADLANGSTAAARRVGFPGASTSATVTVARADLFEAAVRWASADSI